MKIEIRSQSKEKQKIFDKLLFGNIFYFLFCWFCLSSFLYEENFRLWVTGIIWALTGLLIFLVLTLFKDKLLSPVPFHYLVFLLSLSNGILIFDTALRLMINSTNLQTANKYFLIAINVVITIGGITAQVLAVREKLNNATKHNIKSGRLNIDNGFWDLAVPIYFDSKENENEKTKNLNRISKLSPIVTAITFITARAVEGKTQTMITAGILFIMSAVYIWGWATHLAIGMQLQEWEKIYKIKTTLR